MYGGGGGFKLLSGIKSMYVDSSAVRVKGGESERFRIDRGVSCLLGCSIYIYGWSDEVGEDGDMKEGSELPGRLEREEIT